MIFEPTIMLLTCAIILVINIFFAYRNEWVYDHLMDLNRFENGEHVIRRYLSYDDMMNRWWIWDIEKLKVENKTISES